MISDRNVISIIQFNESGTALSIDASGSMSVTSGVMTGSTSTAKPVIIGSVDSGKIVRGIAIDASGSLMTINVPSTKFVYVASNINVAPGTTPTDIVTITGSSTKIVKILRIILSTTQGTAANNLWLVVKRSSANSGGTSTTTTPVPCDSQSPSASATIRQYTANPASLGSTVGTVHVARMFAPVTTTAAISTPYVFDFTNAGISSGIILRGTGEVLALNFNGAALPASLLVSYTIEFIEE